MTEQRYKLAVIVASAGGLHAVSEILGSLPASLPLAIAVVVHRSVTRRDHLCLLLSHRTALRVKSAEPGDPLAKGCVYVAPGGAHLVLMRNRTFRLSHGPKVRHVRPAGDVLLESAAAVLGPHLLAVVVTGGDSDGSDGIVKVKRHGGTTIAQCPSTSAVSSMPSSAIASGAVDYVLTLAEIGPAIERLARETVTRADVAQ